MSFSFLGLGLLALLVVGAAVLVAVALARLARGGEEGGEKPVGAGRIVLGSGCALLAIGALSVVLGGTRVFTSAPAVSVQPPPPGGLVVHAVGTSSHLEALVSVAEGVANQSVPEGVRVVERGSSRYRSDGLFGDSGHTITFLAFKAQADAESGSTGPERDGSAPLADPLDFDEFMLGYGFSVREIVAIPDADDDVRIVIGYRSLDGRVDRAAELRRVEEALMFVEVTPSEVYASDVPAWSQASTVAEPRAQPAIEAAAEAAIEAAAEAADGR